MRFPDFKEILENKDSVEVLKDRPDFGETQIRDLTELVVGVEYIRHGMGVEGTTFVLLDIPYLDENREGWINVRTKYGSSVLNLGDLGVSPYRGYKDGHYRWHRYHWVEEISK